MITQFLIRWREARRQKYIRKILAKRVAGKVESKFDGTITPTGRGGAIWSLPEERLPRDPWIWALHGAQP